MIEIKEVENIMKESAELIELQTRISIVKEYIKNTEYPSIKMICTILGIEYKEED